MLDRQYRREGNRPENDVAPTPEQTLQLAKRKKCTKHAIWGNANVMSGRYVVPNHNACWKCESERIRARRDTRPRW